jgi:antitoxin (DNA-binding transcriptional repressor) of toxin-antitoxin stability system
VAIAALAGLAALALVLALSGGRAPLRRPPRPGAIAPPSGAALAYRPGREAAFSARATRGEAQALFTQSPGGALATAARVAAWRPLIDRATAGTPVAPTLLEAIVFLESAGRPDALAGPSVADAAGLTQILASTGASLLGMRIDLARSGSLSAQIVAAQGAGRQRLAAALERARARVDQRFDPAAALAATVRYLEIARAHFGRIDLAVESYHMGIGNLQHILDLYDGGAPVPYAQLFFDVMPNRHGAAWQALHGLLDDSELYWWRVLGAEWIMRLYRGDRAALRRESALETSYPSDAEALLGGAQGFRDPAALSAAYRTGELVPLPSDAGRLGLSFSPAISAPAARHVPRVLYHGLRPAALALLALIGAQVQAVSGTRAPLIVSGAVVDQASQRRSGVIDAPAATGYTFQLARRYASAAQALALQAVLDRLQALDLIGWFRSPTAIEVTVAPGAPRVLVAGV